MITEYQYEEVGKLMDRRDNIRELLRSFKSPHVTAMVGIVDINSASKHDPKPSSMASFFHNRFGKKVKQLNDDVVKMLELELGKINLEISQHISSDT